MRKGREMSTTLTTRIKLHGCRVVGVTTNAVKGTGRITLEHALDEELAEMVGPLGYWARQELHLTLDLRQQQEPLPLRTDLTTEPTREVKEALDKMGPLAKVTVTGGGRSVEMKPVNPDPWPGPEGWTDEVPVRLDQAEDGEEPDERDIPLPAPVFLTSEGDSGNG
jgi:hypothetical protein